MTVCDAPCFRCGKERESFAGLPTNVVFRRPIIDRDKHPLAIPTRSFTLFEIHSNYFCNDCEKILGESDIEKLKYIKSNINELIKWKKQRGD